MHEARCPSLKHCAAKPDERANPLSGLALALVLSPCPSLSWTLHDVSPSFYQLLEHDSMTIPRRAATVEGSTASSLDSQTLLTRA